MKSVGWLFGVVIGLALVGGCGNDEEEPLPQTPPAPTTPPPAPTARSADLPAAGDVPSQKGLDHGPQDHR